MVADGNRRDVCANAHHDTHDRGTLRKANNKLLSDKSSDCTWSRSILECNKCIRMGDESARRSAAVGGGDGRGGGERYLSHTKRMWLLPAIRSTHTRRRRRRQAEGGKRRHGEGISNAPHTQRRKHTFTSTRMQAKRQVNKTIILTTNTHKKTFTTFTRSA